MGRLPSIVTHDLKGAHMAQVLILGSQGELRTDAATGIIVDSHLLTDEYEDIARFDPVTIAHALQDRAVHCLDILSVGYWTITGEYAVPLTRKFSSVDGVMEIEHWVECARLPAPDTSAPAVECMP